MKAEEVLRRYAAGERNFSEANLQGCNFKGQNLSDTDFSHAEIQGTNFTEANLSGANFTKAKAGVQRQWMIAQLLIALVLSALLGVLSGLAGTYARSFLALDYIQNYTPIPGILILVVIAVTFIAVICQGFTVAAFGMIAFAFAFAFVLAFVFAGAGAGAGTGTIAGAVAGAVAGTGAGAGTFAVAFAVAFAFVFAGAGAVAGAVTGTVAFAGAGAGAVAGAGAGAGAGAFAGAGALLGLYVARQANKGDEKFALVQIIGVGFGAIGGTTFYKANLTDANFTKATLKSTHLRTANLTRVCWNNAQKLDCARVGDSILANTAVRSLLVTRNGYKKSFVNANLRGANLDGVNLNEANLKQADLSGASLRRAELRNANLAETLAIEADLTGASLTGACLQAWNIDHTTTLENIDCQFVFLLEQANERGDRERRPHDPNKVFQPGDFEKLYREVMNTVQILLRNGINREAFAEAFQKLMTKHPDVDFDSIQAIEKKGNDVLLTLEVPETADKAKIAQDFLKPYEDRVRQLEAAVDRLTLHSTDMKEIALALAQRSITFTNQVVGEGKAVQEKNDSSRKIEIGSIGGDFNASGQALNLGDISGTVTNAINQLPASPESDRLKDLLVQLQAAIETDPQLPQDDKATALEQVKELAAAGQAPNPEEKRSIGKRASQMLKGIAASLPDAVKLTEACGKLLPMILPLVGL